MVFNLRGLVAIAFARISSIWVDNQRPDHVFPAVTEMALLRLRVLVRIPVTRISGEPTCRERAQTRMQAQTKRLPPLSEQFA